MATYTNLNLSRLANAALTAFTKTLLPLTRFSTSFSPQDVPRMNGNVVLVPLIGSATATTFGGSYAICGGTKTVITVTINRHKVVHIGQTDLDAVNNSDSSLESFGFVQGQALGQAVMEDILTLVTTANFTSVASVNAAALSPTELRAARLALNQANAPREPRAGLIECVGYDGLLSITNFVQAQMFKDQGVLQEGKVMRALGIDLFEVNAPFVSAASVNAFIAHGSAIAIAIRYLNPQQPSEYQSAQAISDAATGATFGLRDVYDPLTGTRYIALECNYGYSAGITNGGRIIKRAD